MSNQTRSHRHGTCSAILSAGLLALALPVAAQVTQIQPCTQRIQPITLTVGVAIAPPLTQFDSLTVLLADTPASPIALTFPVRNGKWTPTREELEQLMRLQQGQLPVQQTHRLSWRVMAAAANHCEEAFALASIPTPEGPQLVPQLQAALSDFDQCRDLAGQWQQEIAHGVASGTVFTLIVFLEDRGPCYWNRDYGVEGDPIYVGMVTAAREWTAPAYEPCALEAAGPKILIGAGNFELVPGAQGKIFALKKYPPRRCFNGTVTITLSGKREGEVIKASFALNQYERYRATLQLGVVSSNLRDESFAVRPDGGSFVVYSKGPTGRGPEYNVTLVIYALPKYLGSLIGKPRYAGRDVIHDQDLLDRIGVVAGIGLSDPGDRFIYGFAFDLVAGVNLLAVWEAVKVKKLVAFQVGDTVPSLDTELATTREWEDAFVLGASIDLRYVTALFGRK